MARRHLHQVWTKGPAAPEPRPPSAFPDMLVDLPRRRARLRVTREAGVRFSDLRRTCPISAVPLFVHPVLATDALRELLAELGEERSRERAERFVAERRAASDLEPKCGGPLEL